MCFPALIVRPSEGCVLSATPLSKSLFLPFIHSLIHSLTHPVMPPAHLVLSHRLELLGVAGPPGALHHCRDTGGDELDGRTGAGARGGNSQGGGGRGNRERGMVQTGWICFLMTHCKAALWGKTPAMHEACLLPLHL